MIYIVVMRRVSDGGDDGGDEIKVLKGMVSV